MVDVARACGEADSDLAEISASDLRHEFERYLPSEPPATWELSLPQAEFSVGEDEETTFNIRLDAANPGRSLLAVKVVNADNQEEFVLSDVFVLNVDPPSVTTRDTLGLLSPQPAEETVREKSRELTPQDEIIDLGPVAPIPLEAWFPSSGE